MPDPIVESTLPRRGRDVAMRGEHPAPASAGASRRPVILGCVMLARSEKNGEAVAIKTLLPEVAITDQGLRRFMREIEVAAALDHPNIVRYLESGTHNGAVYLVTE